MVENVADIVQFISDWVEENPPIIQKYSIQQAELQEALREFKKHARSRKMESTGEA